MMQLRPILSTLSRHKTAALLIVLEIGLTCAIVCNAVFLILNRIDRLQFPSGMADQELVHVAISSIGRDPESPANTRIDLAALRAIPRGRRTRGSTWRRCVPFPACAARPSSTRSRTATSP